MQFARHPYILTHKFMISVAAMIMAAGMVGAPLHAHAAPSCGQSAEGFDTWLAAFRQHATEAGISPGAIELGLKDVRYDRAVISHDRGQKVFHQSFEVFAGRMVNSYRLSKGRSLLKHYAGMFQRIEQTYGVPGPVLVAIWGLETDFGAGSGDFHTLSALATLS